MSNIGFHASHEQFAPSALVKLVQHAADAGFGSAMCSDHFMPFSERQGQSGFAWSWLGAAMQATELPFGIVNAPGQRYHPAIIAQAAATLAEMFPERFWLALGSGENLNEHITGERWPPKEERRERLGECASIIRRLFAGETVTHRGRVRVSEARLYTRPAVPPPIFAAAVSAETAAWAGSWADGLITVNQPPESLRRVVDAFREGGGGRKPVFLQAHVAWAENADAAVEAAFDQWRVNVFGSALLWDVALPAQLDAAATVIRREDMHACVRISSDLGRHTAWLQEDLKLGFDRVYVHHVGRDQLRFIDTFGQHVLPRVAG